MPDWGFGVLLISISTMYEVMVVRGAQMAIDLDLRKGGSMGDSHFQPEEESPCWVVGLCHAGEPSKREFLVMFKFVMRRAMRFGGHK
jgi:hypothetical protein